MLVSPQKPDSCKQPGRKKGWQKLNTTYSVRCVQQHDVKSRENVDPQTVKEPQNQMSQMLKIRVHHDATERGFTQFQTNTKSIM